MVGAEFAAVVSGCDQRQVSAFTRGVQAHAHGFFHGMLGEAVDHDFINRLGLGRESRFW